jgi:hypothetical protein
MSDTKKDHNVTESEILIKMSSIKQEQVEDSDEYYQFIDVVYSHIKYSKNHNSYKICFTCREILTRHIAERKCKDHLLFTSRDIYGM